MKPASAMSFALRKPGRSVCANAGTDLAVVTDIAASAAERRRSRFVNMMLAPVSLEGYLLLLDSVQFTLTTAGGFHDPSMIEGDASFGSTCASSERSLPSEPEANWLPCPCLAIRSGSRASTIHRRWASDCRAG